MVRRVVFPFLLGCGLLLAGCYSGPYMHRPAWSRQADSVAVMTNHDVIAMTKSGVKESVILNLVKRSAPDFQLGPNDVVALSDSGVSENVINAMIKAQDNAPAVGASRRYSYYDPYWYGWYGGYPYWYWGLTWDPWFYYPHSYYSWYRPHYFGFGGGFHTYFRGGSGFYGGMRTGGRHR